MDGVAAGILLGIILVLALSGVVPLYDRTSTRSPTELQGMLRAGWEVEHIAANGQANVFVLRRPRLRLPIGNSAETSTPAPTAVPVATRSPAVVSPAIGPARP